jgi:UrcA family protein
MTMTRAVPLPFAAALGAVVLLTAAAPPAAAEPFILQPTYSADPAVVVTRARVPYSEVDIASPDGARALLKRIEEAADAVCGAPNPVSDQAKADVRACRADAIAGAVSRLGNPEVRAAATGGEVRTRR